MALDFESASVSGKLWLAALQWMKAVFARQQRLAKQPLAEIPLHTIPKRLAGWPWVVASPGLPQIRTCATHASYVQQHIRCVM